MSILNTFSRTLFVAKISLGAFLPQELVDLELVPNLNDCFLLSEKAVNKLGTKFKEPNKIDEETGKKIIGEVIEAYPSEGSKFIGLYRDKGSITKVMRKYIPYVKYQLNNEQEVSNFNNLLADLDINDVRDLGNNTIMFPIDIIAHNSSARDNVTSLVLHSCLELECAIEDKTLEVSEQEIMDMDVREVVGRRQHSHEVVMVNVATGEEVYSFGKKPILLEDFFWQPQHDNKYALKEKDVSVHYHQALDGMATLVPTLYEAVVNTVDYSSVKEDLIILGMEIGTREHNERVQIKEEIKDIDDLL